MRFLKAKIRLEDGSKIMALFNTSIEINVIIKKVIENTELVIKQRLKLK